MKNRERAKIGKKLFVEEFHGTEVLNMEFKTFCLSLNNNKNDIPIPYDETKNCKNIVAINLLLMILLAIELIAIEMKKKATIVIGLTIRSNILVLIIDVLNKLLPSVFLKLPIPYS
ncbi:hypothetical protein [Candidatus Mycoplasma mahonii]|uniref:hypothetical protein n=1 Tax=Candidatus Mycoplasma mahonii TaxID=3004105 RepID=UPI0026F02CD5|nr:hypothetical protein [Candidatus Mycoplasma mahonii]WKX02179.1 hypothetical protein O3I44_02130 [Candidatus Mycoplasma mahonii]